METDSRSRVSVIDSRNATVGTSALAAVSVERLLALLIIKVKPLTSVDNSRSAPCVVSGGLAADWLAQ